jgi:hypothetical protein
LQAFSPSGFPLRPAPAGWRTFGSTIGAFLGKNKQIILFSCLKPLRYL